ncbi:hypothetical protein LIER_34786 [Lithospermum erythrorhizon]|uniref:Transmembrane protein n=1 Tax=Lithospermum erythrorhizon TaxID=34254 RepID=A0AAV3S0N1_LITER
MAAKYGSKQASKLLFLLMMLMVFLNINQISGLTISTNNNKKPGRILDEQDKTSESLTKINDDDTVRTDPLDGFNKYRGGYDITNKHYWSSIAYTGISGYIIGIIWLLGGLVYGGFLIAKRFCCGNRGKLKKRHPPHQQYHILSSLLVLVFTILALTATCLVLGANAKFHSRAETVIDIIIDTADEASNTIYNTTGAMKDMSNSLGTTNAENGEASDFLVSTSYRLDDEADDIQRQARKHRRAIDKGLKIMYIITTVIFSMNLIVILALPVFRRLQKQRAFHLLIVLCWVLTAICWLIFGIYFFLSKFAGDTCTALEGFRQDPYNNSLSSIVPCDELLSARSVISEVRQGIFSTVNEVNKNISTSFGNIVQICNPFSGPPAYQYNAGYCPENTIKIGDVPQILRMIACTGSEPNAGSCNGGIFISTNEFNSVVAYTTSIQNLFNVFPGMEELIECQTVKDAFTVIVQDHCKPLKRNVRIEWISLVILAIAMVLLVLTWTTKAYHEQIHHSLGGSVKPHVPDADNLESGTRSPLEKDTNPAST